MSVSVPWDCPIGKSYLLDAPVSFDSSKWTTLNQNLGGGDHTGVFGVDVLSRYGVLAYSTVVTGYGGNGSYYACDGIISNSSYVLTSFSATLDINFRRQGSIFGSYCSAVLQIEAGPIIMVGVQATDDSPFSESNSIQIRILNRSGSDLYVAYEHDVARGTMLYSGSRTFRVEQNAPGVFDVYMDDVLLVSGYDSGIVGARKIYLEPAYYASGFFPSGLEGSWDGHNDWRNLYYVGDDLPNACGIDPSFRIGLAHGFEGFISVFSDDSISGTVHSNPQALHVDQDNLSFEKEIVVKGDTVGDGRVTNGSAVVYKAAKPQGGLTYQFRSSDLLKVAYSHFQLGTGFGTSAPYRYQFYPKKDPLDWSATGTSPRGTYGKASGKPYSISVLKRLHNPASAYGGTNSFFFKHGICDKLGFRFGVGDDAKVQPSFKFRDLDPGTAVSATPNSTTVGSYAATPSFMDWAATITMDGTGLPVSSFSLMSDQGAQEFSRLGRQAPENYNFDQYKLTGEFSFDLPLDALKEVGSMFGSRTFSFVATLFNGTADQVVFELPYCRRMPFEYRVKSGAESIRSSIPFEAFENAGTYPIRITVDTDYSFNGLV